MIAALLLSPLIAPLAPFQPPPTQQAGQETPDGFEVQLYGRYQVDWQDFDPDADTSLLLSPVEDDLRLRSLRLGLQGQFTPNLPFRLDYELKGVDYRRPRDIWLGFEGLSAASIKAGHIKEPFGLERQGSAKDALMIELGLANSLTPGRNLGVLFSDPVKGGRMTWAAGFFRGTQHLDEWDDDGETAITGRLTAIPVDSKASERLVHIGAAFSHRSPDGDAVGFSTDPEAAFAPDYLDTGSVAADSVELIGLEAAYMEGPWTVQGEWMKASVDAISGDDPAVSAYYITLGRFLSQGDRRRYETDRGRFGGVTPLRPWTSGGDGAWEAVARYSYADFQSGPAFNGNELWTLGVGVNWYLDAHSRFSLNLCTADLDEVGDTDMLLARFQVAF